MPSFDAPTATAAAEPPFRPRRSRARLGTILAVVAALLMIGAVAAIQYFGLPDFLRLSALPVEAGGSLEIENQRADRRRLASGNELLEVTGEIVNRIGEVQRVPQIRAELRDAGQQPLYSWSIAPPVRELQPNGRVAFVNANINVPQGGRSISLTFGPMS